MLVAIPLRRASFETMESIKITTLIEMRDSPPLREASSDANLMSGQCSGTRGWVPERSTVVAVQVIMLHDSICYVVRIPQISTGAGVDARCAICQIEFVPRAVQCAD